MSAADGHPAPSSDDLPALAERCWRALETVHVVSYFAPEVAEALRGLGLRGRHQYVAARSAPMGAVSPGVAEATFYVFAPSIVRAALPEAWTVATPAQVLEARHAGTVAALERVLGDLADAPEVADAAALARRVTDTLTAPGRALYAGHADLPWPDQPLLALWHAASLLREHRGDAHVALLVADDVTPVEALELEAAYRPGKAAFLRGTRGWSEEAVTAGRARLVARGWVEADRDALTDAGTAYRDGLEGRTRALALPAWEALGAEAAAHLLGLVRPLARAVVVSGVLPGTLDANG